ncbi:hypothetical protein [Paenibacillus sp. OK003]|uniref:hypothetical protein n=1 Tax=Paenibacillus sp. OK003 TaxID=1884380 RepID=UPI0008AD28E9|nr:hypothetical protein [Paenibacillus sp. OK003]SEK70556.1 hypothetical protein SAMN05518856_10441 [Paenibacillus sp. OK003]
MQAAVVQSGGSTLIHAIDPYDKMKTHPDGTIYTKMDRVSDLASPRPLPPYSGYVLVNSWFKYTRVIDNYAAADVAWHIRKEDVRLRDRDSNCDHLAKYCGL